MKRVPASPMLGVLLATAVLPLFGGCTLGPDYKRPTLDMPAGFRDAGAASVGEGAAVAAASSSSWANIPWWELFRDPKLQDLIRIALAENQDLLIAVERIVEAEARVGFVRADLFPKVDASLDAGRFEQSREAFPNNPPPGSNDASLYNIGASVTWEIDLFGRIRRSTESQRAQLLATEEARRAVAISLVAAVAGTYVDLRDADLRLEISRRTLESRAKAVDLTRVRFRGGLTSEKDPQQAEAEYRRVEVTVLRFEQLVRQLENSLSVLVGRRPGDIVRGEPINKGVVGRFQIPAGLPSELLDRRPDLLAAEQQLHSVTANVGAAKALLFPRIALTADLGTSSTELDALFTGSSQAWSVAAGLLQPIFNAGKNLRRVDIAESQMRQALYEYEKSVLQALREVDDSLIGYRQTGLARGAQSLRVQAERRVVQLTMVRYEGGVTDYLEVLDAQRSLFTAELDEVQTISANVGWLIQLYKALGGGWPTGPEAGAAAGERTS